MRVLAAAFTALLLTVAVIAQHKIPPLPETASQPKRVSGVRIIDIKVGTGVPAEPGRILRIHFTGWVSKTQVMFDFRDEHTGALAFRLGDGTTMKGLDRGVRGMRVGGKRRIIVPPSLGFGSRANKAVPAGSELTYDVELVAVARPGV